jgi:hypothetical protein
VHFCAATPLRPAAVFIFLYSIAGADIHEDGLVTGGEGRRSRLFSVPLCSCLSADLALAAGRAKAMLVARWRRPGMRHGSGCFDLSWLGNRA